MMRAVLVRKLGSVDGASVAETPPPEAGPGQVLIRVLAAPLNFADLLVLQGKYQRLPELPYVPGTELVGTVTAVGDGVSRFHPGDRVLAFVGHGAFAEEAVATEGECFLVPESLSDVDAACLGLTYQTAHFALVTRAGLGAGETVLVTGASGGVGLAAIQLAKARGAVILAGLTSLAKASLATDSGADHIIDLTGDSLKDTVRDQVHAATDGRGVDVVLESVGGEVFEACLRALAWEGRAIVIGFVGGQIPSARANYLLIKNIAVAGLYLDSYRRHAPDKVAAAQKDIFDLATAGRLKPSIMACLPLERFAEAFGHIQARTAAGRIVLKTESP